MKFLSLMLPLWFPDNGPLAMNVNVIVVVMPLTNVGGGFINTPEFLLCSSSRLAILLCYNNHPAILLCSNSRPAILLYSNNRPAILLCSSNSPEDRSLDW